MCLKCVRKLKRLGLPNNATYGQIKAMAHIFNKDMFSIIRLRGVAYDCKGNMFICPQGRKFDLGVEAHMYKINRARTKRRYIRKPKHKNKGC